MKKMKSMPVKSLLFAALIALSASSALAGQGDLEPCPTKTGCLSQSVACMIQRVTKPPLWKQVLTLGIAGPSEEFVAKSFVMDGGLLSLNKFFGDNPNAKELVLAMNEFAPADLIEAHVRCSDNKKNKWSMSFYADPERGPSFVGDVVAGE